MAGESVDFSLVPIGTVESSVRDRRLMPPHGAPATVVIEPAYVEAMYRLEQNSHIWIIGWYLNAERKQLQIVRPEYPSGGRRRGVFGLRSTTRPNLIATSVSKIARIVDNRIELERLDLLNGTPVLDIKRYSVTWDSVHSARSSRAMQAEVAMLSATEELEHAGALFNGARSAGIVLAARLVQYVCRVWDIRPKDERLAFSLPVDRVDGALLDGIQGMTGATFGNRRLRHERGEVIAVTDGERHLHTWPKPTGELDPDHIRTESVEHLFEMEMV